MKINNNRTAHTPQLTPSLHAKDAVKSQGGKGARGLGQKLLDKTPDFKPVDWLTTVAAR